jgi:surface glycoprotein (TIGR04207 family)
MCVLKQSDKLDYFVKIAGHKGEDFMHNTTKRIIAVLMSVVMVLSVFGGMTFTASTAASGTCGANGSNVTWTLSDNGVLTISGTGDMADYSS